MYCDRSAYYQKAIKATARCLKTNTNLLWLFLLFGRLVFFYHNDARSGFAFSFMEVWTFHQTEQIQLIQQLYEEDKSTVFKIIDKILTTKKSKDFFNRKVATL